MEQEDGGAHSNNMVRAVSGSNIGGAGGDANVNTDWNGWAATGGVGNPGGQSYFWNGSQYINIENGANGTGGLLNIFAGTFDNKGNIEAEGVTNTLIGDDNPGGVGGASGGGSINIFYHNLVSKGEISTKGGESVRGTYGAASGAGGNGSITMGSIATGSFVLEYKNY